MEGAQLFVCFFLAGISCVLANIPVEEYFVKLNSRELVGIDPYFIAIGEGGVQILFNETEVTAQFIFDINITEGQQNQLNPIEVYDRETCNTTEFSTGIFNPHVYTEQGYATGDGYEIIPTMTELYLLNITEPQYSGNLFVPVSDYLSNIEFCLKLTTGTIEFEGFTDSIAFKLLRFQIGIAMDQGFTNGNGWVVDVSEQDDTTLTGITTALGESGVSACQCDASTRLCIDQPPAITQNSAISICIESNTNGISINSIKELKMNQNGFTIYSVNNFEVNSITTLSAMHTKTEVVTTRLISIFFNSPSPVIVSGVALLEFESGRRRRLSSVRLDNRSLQDNAGQGSFQVELEVDLSSAVEPRAGDGFANLSRNFINFVVILSAGLGVLSV